MTSSLLLTSGRDSDNNDDLFVFCDTALPFSICDIWFSSTRKRKWIFCFQTSRLISFSEEKLILFMRSKVLLILLIWSAKYIDCRLTPLAGVLWNPISWKPDSGKEWANLSWTSGFSLKPTHGNDWLRRLFWSGLEDNIGVKLSGNAISGCIDKTGKRRCGKVCSGWTVLDNKLSVLSGSANDCSNLSLSLFWRSFNFNRISSFVFPFLLLSCSKAFIT